MNYIFHLETIYKKNSQTLLIFWVSLNSVEKFKGIREENSISIVRNEITLYNQSIC